MPSKKPLQLLIDADMILYQQCCVAEKEIQWDTDLFTLHSDPNEVITLVDDKIQTIVQDVLDHLNHEGAYEIQMCFSCDTGNFRKQVLSTYKANRAGKRKPLAYYFVKQWIKDNYNCYQKDSLEADDCIGILATIHQDNCVVISADKDFKTIPCQHNYNYQKREWADISEAEADYNFYKQTLMGDATDGYGGCKGVGEVGAKKIVDKDCSWKSVLAAFTKAGHSEDEAIRQARCARILRKQDYDFKTKEVLLWTPPNYQKME